jgi:hypothetical protein
MLLEESHLQKNCMAYIVTYFNLIVEGNANEDLRVISSFLNSRLPTGEFTVEDNERDDETTELPTTTTETPTTTDGSSNNPGNSAGNPPNGNGSNNNNNGNGGWCNTCNPCNSCNACSSCSLWGPVQGGTSNLQQCAYIDLTITQGRGTTLPRRRNRRSPTAPPKVSMVNTVNVGGGGGGSGGNQSAGGHGGSAFGVVRSPTTTPPPVSTVNTVNLGGGGGGAGGNQSAGGSGGSTNGVVIASLGSNSNNGFYECNGDWIYLNGNIIGNSYTYLIETTSTTPINTSPPAPTSEPTTTPNAH